jgi:hypothetical protein
MPKFGTSVGENIEPNNLRLAALIAASLVADRSSDADVSKLMAQIKVPSKVVSDTTPTVDEC